MFGCKYLTALLCMFLPPTPLPPSLPPSLPPFPGQRSLPDVYKDITEMQVDISKYKHWVAKEKQLPNNMRAAANILHYMYMYVRAQLCPVTMQCT